MKKIFLNPWTALFTLSIILLIRWWDPNFIESVRLRYFDQLIVSQSPKTIPVYTVNIDEASLDKYGQWPFPRDIYSEIIKELYQRNAGLVVFNVMMPEKDRFGKDKVLAETLDQFPVVLPAVGSIKSKNKDQGNNIQIVGLDPSGRVVEYPGLINSLDELVAQAAGVGIVNTFPEIDGVVRRMPLVIIAGDNLHAALSLETLRVANNDKIQVKIGTEGVEALRIPSIGRFNTDNIGRIWIDWSAIAQEYSLVKLPKDFEKGIVIVGLSAAGLVNPIATAKGEVWPQQVQAATIGTMLTGEYIQRPDKFDLIELGLILSLGVLLIFLMRWPYLGLASTVLIISSIALGSIYIFQNKLFLLDATLPTVGLLLVGLHAYGVKFLTEFLQKQQIRKQFQSYLSPDLVAKLIKDPSLLKLGGEEKELSIMFTDVRGFTSISEHYGKDVQGLTKIMNRYMTAMTKKILENDGTLDKYIGDAQMAFWNAPLDETQHCKDAVKAALEMLNDLEKFNEEITKEGIPAFGMGLGINTGVVVVGNMGSEQRFDYTCLGDAVNLASRLEGQSKNYGVKIVLGPITAERLGKEYFTLELDCIAVKGKKEGVTIYTVFYNPPFSDTLKQWERSRELHDLMLTYYRKQQWDKAISLVNSLKGEFDRQLDEYYELWLDRIEDMKAADLAADWDGVYRATSK